ncbi:hypothetical protein DDZ14_05980 [Maritimibacter sp. 55A14]|uniref:hypothetical protein n=1 Tax=Maritimibacter sp. 55A14 TaxID=2174844 RepID=UPI000D621B5D|nr:hypothetical protein [Maritimibacter sp. 55A14]PWE33328.1 hypothetical protein DDZ14_05980 [Maritimibacter sp. 55A14]
MALGRDHELHTRRRSRNLGVGLVLGAFVLIVFGITIAKLSSGQMMEAFDHTIRPSLAEQDK